MNAAHIIASLVFLGLLFVGAMRFSTVLHAARWPSMIVLVLGLIIVVAVAYLGGEATNRR